jgi:N-acetyl-gamma-glutamyl-phosphate reductase
MMHNYSHGATTHLDTFITVSVVGARGYTGLETAKQLLRHPYAKLTHCFATSDFSLSQYLQTKKVSDVKCLSEKELFNNLTDVVFLATPAEASLKLAPEILKQGKKVIDLSGAFRLKKNDYPKWYGFTHEQNELLQAANYGLVPFAQFSESNLVANPGCYASSVLMALIPLIKKGLIQTETIVIDAKSGTTGAGKKASENLLFTEVDGECLPYKIGKHQHLPEIIEAVEQFTGVSIDPFFTTHLLPTRRGILSSLYMKVKPGVTIEQINDAYAHVYANNPLVFFGESDKQPQLLSLKKVVGTAHTHLSYHLKGEQLFLFSTIDNLMKGAASQAIENFNRLYDFPLETGLEEMEAFI